MCHQVFVVSTRLPEGLAYVLAPLVVSMSTTSHWLLWTSYTSSLRLVSDEKYVMKPACTTKRTSATGSTYHALGLPRVRDSARYTPWTRSPASAISVRMLTSTRHSLPLLLPVAVKRSSSSRSSHRPSPAVYLQRCLRTTFSLASWPTMSSGLKRSRRTTPGSSSGPRMSGRHLR